MQPVALPFPQSVAPPAGSMSLRRAAQALETAFLAEMLRAAGTVAAAAGEDDPAYGAVLAEAQARALVARGGLGLTEPILRMLERRAAGPEAAPAGGPGA